MGSKSKQKGAGFEREICKRLSLWLSNGERSDLFWRSAMSGGRATLALKSGDKLSNQAGDITAIDSLGQRLLNRFVIELKFYQDLGVPALLLKRKGVLCGFWECLVDDAFGYSKYPMLIAKQNYAPPMLLLDIHGHRYFCGQCKGALRAILPYNVNSTDCTIYMYDLEEVLSEAPPNFEVEVL